MNLKKLKYFNVLAKELNFVIAANKLYIDPSSLSRAIQSLELSFGATLFERNSRQIKLTHHGDMLLQCSNEIFYLIDTINIKIKTSTKKELETIELAISPNIDGYKVAELLTIYREQYPQMQLNIHETSYQNILYGLKQGQYHYALSLHKPTKERSNLVTTKLWHEKLIVLLPKRHPLLSLPVVKLEDIEKFPFISLQPDTFLYEMIYTDSFTPPTTLFVKSYSVLQLLVMAGYGISLVTENMFNNMQNEHIITRNIESPLMVNTYLIHKNNADESCNKFNSINKTISSLYP